MAAAGVRLAGVGGGRLARGPRHTEGDGVSSEVHASRDRRPAGARPTSHRRGSVHAAGDPSPAARRPGQRVHRVVPAREGAAAARAVLRGVHAANLTRRPRGSRRACSEPMSSRLGVPRVEWSVGFDVLLATNFLPPGDDEPRRGPGRARPRVRAVARDRPAHGRSMAPPVRRRGCRRPRGVIVPSQSTKHDLLAAHEVDEARRVDVDAARRGHAGVPPAPHEAVEARAPHVRDRPALRAVRGRHRAAQEPRTLVHAFATLRGRRDAPGDRRRAGAVGSRGRPSSSMPSIAALPAAARGRASIRTGYVSDREKVALMTGASMLAYPSLLRGVRVPGAGRVRGGAAGAHVERVVAARGDGRRGDARGSRGRRRDRGGHRRSCSATRDLRAMLAAAGLARVSGFTWEATARAHRRGAAPAHETARG